MLGWKTVMNNIVEHYQQQFQQGKTHFPSLGDWHDHNFAAFAKLGIPSRKTESWKYVNLHDFNQQAFALKPKTADQNHQSIDSFEDCYRLVIQDGCFRSALSAFAQQEGVNISDLAEVLRETPELITDCLSQSTAEQAAFTALNNAFMQHGVVIQLAKQVVLDRPLVIEHVMTQRQFAPVKIIILAEAGSQAQIIEHYSGQAENYFVNVETFCHLQAQANVTHYKIIKEHVNSFHIGQTTIKQEADSLCQSFVLTIDGGLVRSDTHVSLVQPGARTELYGISLTQAKQTVDHHTEIHHVAAHTESVEYYKGLATGQSRLIFNGKVRVEQDAQHIKSEQHNKNLLLSEKAEIDTKPELEIFADDVKCSHGAAIGELDQDALFYLRSRGISLVQAKQLLLHAFIDEILDKVSLRECRQLIQRYLDTQLTALEME